MHRWAILSLLLPACGGVPRPGPVVPGPSATAAEQHACAFTRVGVEASPYVRIAGMRVHARFTARPIQFVGMAALAHECGAVLVFAEVPPDLPADERAAYAEGLSDSLHGEAQCAPAGADVVRCDGRYLREVRDGDIWSWVQLTGDMPVEAALAVLRSVAPAPGARWDPLAAMRLTLTPPDGMVLGPMSSAPVLQYIPRPDATQDNGTELQWTFYPYVLHPSHADASPLTDREAGQVAGQLARANLHLDSLSGEVTEAAVLRQTELGTDVEVVTPGTRDGQPVDVYLAFFREPGGVFVIVGVTTPPKRAAFLERVRPHVRSYQVSPGR